jgi:hypothetical protein
VGASRWIYFAENQDDPRTALGDLRRRVFEESFADEAGSLEEFDAGGFLDEEGTHSILDVDRVAGPGEDEEDGTVRAVGGDEMTEYFGTARPTREQIAAVYKTSASDLPPMFRGSGCFCPYFDDEGGHAGLVFWGMSGD